jgi:small subunit ribosomal protein S20
MPIIKSAKKRVRTTKKATVLNLKTKRGLRSALKSFRTAGVAKDSKALIESQRKVQSALDKAGKKRVMSKHKVARKQRQLAAQAKALNSGSKKATTPTKKTTKAPAKKLAAKKPVKKTSK